MKTFQQRQDLLTPQFRVVVNSRCGRSCFYCRPSGEGVATASTIQLSVDDLIAVAKEVRDQGISSIKLTGGDPALYGPLEVAVARLREIGFDQIEVISRHPLIGGRALELASAGVTQFNLSIDTLNPVLHRQICGVDDLGELKRALDQCVATGVAVKINTVVMSEVNDAELDDLIEWCEASGVKTVKLLDVIKDLDGGSESYARRLLAIRGTTMRDLYVPLSTVAPRARRRAASIVTRSQGGLGHPMTVLTLNSGLELVLKDSRAGTWYGSICQGCRFFPCHDALMALRLTTDLRLQFCLLREEICVPLSALLQSPDLLKETIGQALAVFRTASFRALPVDSSLSDGSK